MIFSPVVVSMLDRPRAGVRSIGWWHPGTAGSGRLFPFRSWRGSRCPVGGRRVSHLVVCSGPGLCPFHRPDKQGCIGGR